MATLVKSRANFSLQNLLRSSFRRAGVIPQIPLTQPFPGVPEISQTNQALAAPAAQLTTLSNGVRVVSQETYGQGATVGVFVDAGSRYETKQTTGASHMMELMAFKTTANRSTFRMVRDIEALGAHVQAAASREHIVYQSDSLRQFAPAALEILADNLASPALLPWELEEQHAAVARETAELESNPEQFVTELIHSTAYFNNTLGLPLLAPKGKLGHLTADALKAYRAEFFTPARLVVVGAGVDHAQFVAAARPLFEGVAGPREKSKPAAARYTGGMQVVKAVTDPEMVHFAVGFETPGWQDEKNLLPVCVLQMMMGGGGSFSAGGPGKGMYSRLYTDALNKNEWLESCVAFNAFYNDSGVFGVHGSAPSAHGDKLADVICGQLVNMANNISAEELSRAKNQLKSAIFMNLESRSVIFEDLGRQVLTYGKRTEPAELCKQIDAITGADLVNAARKLFKTKATVVAFGDTSKVPTYDQVSRRFA